MGTSRRFVNVAQPIIDSSWSRITRIAYRFQVSCFFSQPDTKGRDPNIRVPSREISAVVCRRQHVCRVSFDSPRSTSHICAACAPRDPASTHSDAAKEPTASAGSSSRLTDRPRSPSSRFSLSHASEATRTQVKRLVFARKIYYDLARSDAAHRLVLVEELYPWPHEAVAGIVDSYPAVTEVVWAQEEPKTWRVDLLSPRLSVSTGKMRLLCATSPSERASRRRFIRRPTRPEARAALALKSFRHETPADQTPDCSRRPSSS